MSDKYTDLLITILNAEEVSWESNNINSHVHGGSFQWSTQWGLCVENHIIYDENGIWQFSSADSIYMDLFRDLAVTRFYIENSKFTDASDYFTLFWDKLIKLVNSSYSTQEISNCASIQNILSPQTNVDKAIDNLLIFIGPKLFTGCNIEQSETVIIFPSFCNNTYPVMSTPVSLCTSPGLLHSHSQLISPYGTYTQPSSNPSVITACDTPSDFDTNHSIVQWGPSFKVQVTTSCYLVSPGLCNPGCKIFGQSCFVAEFDVISSGSELEPCPPSYPIDDDNRLMKLTISGGQEVNDCDERYICQRASDYLSHSQSACVELPNGYFSKNCSRHQYSCEMTSGDIEYAPILKWTSSGEFYSTSCSIDEISNGGILGLSHFQNSQIFVKFDWSLSNRTVTGSVWLLVGDWSILNNSWWVLVDFSVTSECAIFSVYHLLLSSIITSPDCVKISKSSVYRILLSIDIANKFIFLSIGGRVIFDDNVTTSNHPFYTNQTDLDGARRKYGLLSEKSSDFAFIFIGPKMYINLNLIIPESFSIPSGIVNGGEDPWEITNFLQLDNTILNRDYIFKNHFWPEFSCPMESGTWPFNDYTFFDRIRSVSDPDYNFLKQVYPVDVSFCQNVEIREPCQNGYTLSACSTGFTCIPISCPGENFIYSPLNCSCECLNNHIFINSTFCAPCPSDSKTDESGTSCICDDIDNQYFENLQCLNKTNFLTPPIFSPSTISIMTNSIETLSMSPDLLSPGTLVNIISNQESLLEIFISVAIIKDQSILSNFNSINWSGNWSVFSQSPIVNLDYIETGELVLFIAKSSHYKHYDSSLSFAYIRGKEQLNPPSCSPDPISISAWSLAENGPLIVNISSIEGSLNGGVFNGLNFTEFPIDESPINLNNLQTLTTDSTIFVRSIDPTGVKESSIYRQCSYQFKNVQDNFQIAFKISLNKTSQGLENPLSIGNCDYVLSRKYWFENFNFFIEISGENYTGFLLSPEVWFGSREIDEYQFSLEEMNFTENRINSSPEYSFLQYFEWSPYNVFLEYSQIQYAFRPSVFHELSEIRQLVLCRGKYKSSISFSIQSEILDDGNFWESSFQTNVLYFKFFNFSEQNIYAIINNRQKMDNIFLTDVQTGPKQLSNESAITYLEILGEVIVLDSTIIDNVNICLNLCLISGEISVPATKNQYIHFFQISSGYLESYIDSFSLNLPERTNADYSTKFSESPIGQYDNIYIFNRIPLLTITNVKNQFLKTCVIQTYFLSQIDSLFENRNFQDLWNILNIESIYSPEKIIDQIEQCSDFREKWLNTNGTEKIDLNLDSRTNIDLYVISTISIEPMKLLSNPLRIFVILLNDYSPDPPSLYVYSDDPCCQIHVGGVDLYYSSFPSNSHPSYLNLLGEDRGWFHGYTSGDIVTMKTTDLSSLLFEYKSTFHIDLNILDYCSWPKICRSSGPINISTNLFNSSEIFCTWTVKPGYLESKPSCTSIVFKNLEIDENFNILSNQSLIDNTSLTEDNVNIFNENQISLNTINDSIITHPLFQTTISQSTTPVPTNNRPVKTHISDPFEYDTISRITFDDSMSDEVIKVTLPLPFTNGILFKMEYSIIQGQVSLESGDFDGENRQLTPLNWIPYDSFYQPEISIPLNYKGNLLSHSASILHWRLSSSSTSTIANSKLFLRTDGYTPMPIIKLIYLKSPIDSIGIYFDFPMNISTGVLLGTKCVLTLNSLKDDSFFQVNINTPNLHDLWNIYPTTSNLYESGVIVTELLPMNDIFSILSMGQRNNSFLDDCNSSCLFYPRVIYDITPIFLNISIDLLEGRVQCASPNLLPSRVTDIQIKRVDMINVVKNGREDSVDVNTYPPSILPSESPDNMIIIIILLPIIFLFITIFLIYRLVKRRQITRKDIVQWILKKCHCQKRWSDREIRETDKLIRLAETWSSLLQQNAMATEFFIENNNTMTDTMVISHLVCLFCSLPKHHREIKILRDRSNKILTCFKCCLDCYEILVNPVTRMKLYKEDNLTTIHSQLNIPTPLTGREDAEGTLTRKDDATLERSVTFHGGLIEDEIGRGLQVHSTSLD